MKKIIVFILIILAGSLYSADLHITPYSEISVKYAKDHEKGAIIWFCDQSEKNKKLERDILSNGQLLAATENFIWLSCNDRNTAGIYGVRDFPTIMCLDRYGDEIYGTRLSYSLAGPDTDLSKAFLFGLEANGLIDGISDDWYDSRYTDNRLLNTPLSYWDTYHPYQPDSRNRDACRSGSSSDFISALLLMYQIYPSLTPIVSETDHGDRKIYRRYRHNDKDRKHNFVYDGDRGNHIYTWDGYRKHHPERRPQKKDPKEEKKEQNRTYKKNKENLKRNNPEAYEKLYGPAEPPRHRKNDIKREERRPQRKNTEKKDRINKKENRKKEKPDSSDRKPKQRERKKK